MTHRTVYRIREGTEVAVETDGRYRITPARSDSVVRLHPPALAVLTLVDGWRSEEEIERHLAAAGHALPAGVVGTLFHRLVEGGVLEKTTTPWKPLEHMPWPAHRCVGCGASCQGHWVGPLDPEFVTRTTARMPELREKYPRLAEDKPFVRLDPEDPALFLNATSGQCIFLDDQMRCILHKELGPTEKPTICQMFPHVRFEDGSTTRLGIGMMCLKHFDQVLDEEPAAQAGHWRAMHGQLDGGLFHYYPPADAAPLEQRLLERLRQADDPMALVLDELGPRPDRPRRMKVEVRLQQLVMTHLARVEKALAEEPIMEALSRRQGLLPERVTAIRRLARGEGGGSATRVPSAASLKTARRLRLLEDALLRFHFLRHYLMFRTLSEGIAAFALGLWVAEALSGAGDEADHRLGETLATWMRVIQSPGVRRTTFHSPREVEVFLATFRRFWEASGA